MELIFVKIMDMVLRTIVENFINVMMIICIEVIAIANIKNVLKISLTIKDVWGIKIVEKNYVDLINIIIKIFVTIEIDVLTKIFMNLEFVM